MSFRVRCPQCDTSLRLGDTASSEVSVRCPQCGISFVAELGQRPRVQATADPAFRERPAPRRHVERKAESSWDEPLVRPRRKSSSRGLVVGIVVAGCLLLTAVIVVVVVLALRGPSAAQAPIVGVWQKQGPMQMERVEFCADGKLLMDFAILRLEKKYRVVDAANLEVEETMFNDFFKNLKVQGLPVQFNENMGAMMKHQVRYELKGEELTFGANTAGLNGTYRRVR